MATRVELRVEELVYDLAEELGLTEAEVLELDALAIAQAAVQRLRIELKKQSGRRLTVQDYRPPIRHSPETVELIRNLVEKVEA